MRYLLHLAAAAISVVASTAQAQPFQTGLSSLDIKASEHHRGLQGIIWYPTQDTAGAAIHHENAVWTGITAIEGAEPAPGAFPLVVLSHGMYGNAMNQSWLAADLAQQGYVVAAINHPGTSTWLREPEDARQLWERPKDITHLIDHMLTASDWRPRIDPARIFMAGHSLGGFTAMMLAGARYDHAGFDHSCAQDPDALVCGIFDMWQVAQTPQDRQQMQADLSDTRIKAFAIFDLGGTQTFSKPSLNRIETPLLVLGAPHLGDETRIDLDVESRALVQALPSDNVTYLEPNGLAHFDFLGLCKPQALDLLRAEEPADAIVCIEGGADRQADHQMISAQVSRFFDEP